MSAESTSYLLERPRLLALAYRMLGSSADAEDMVQEAYLRLQSQQDAVDNPAAWLTTVVTRMCIDQLRSAQQRRQQYIGTWLPEPMLEEAGPDRSPELAESASMALLRVMESLTPVERAVFLLHDVFDYEFKQIAPIVEKSAANCRQLAHRARAHLAAERKFEPANQQTTALANTFLAACQTGDLDELVQMLAADAIVYSDGGGKVTAARRPIAGARDVARFMAGITAKAPPGTEVTTCVVNYQPGLVVKVDGRIDTVGVFEIAGGQIAAIYFVRNPDKLAHLV